MGVGVLIGLVHMPMIVTLKRTVWIAMASCAAACCGCASLERHEFNRVCMGVQCRIVVYSADARRAEAGAGAAFGRIAGLDACMSDYRPDSELMRLCERAGGPPVAVSEDLARVLAVAAQVSEASGGAFDVTAGPAVALWRRARRTGTLPKAAELVRARGLTDWRAVEIDSEGRWVRLAKPGMRLDMGGIGKGYAAQRGLDALRERGLSRSMVALAGDIVVGDAPPGRDGWLVGTAESGSEGPGAGRLTLVNCAVSTSGSSEQYVEIGGVRYSHIINPKTGLGVTEAGHGSVTVVAPLGETADALATALFVLGPDAGQALLGAYPGVTCSFTNAIGAAGDDLTVR